MKKDKVQVDRGIYSTNNAIASRFNFEKLFIFIVIPIFVRFEIFISFSPFLFFVCFNNCSSFLNILSPYHAFDVIYLIASHITIKLNGFLINFNGNGGDCWLEAAEGKKKENIEILPIL
jgi:hypothetical protein